MKLAIGFALFFWLLCGLIGAWRLDELDVHHWQTVASGPLSFARAMHDKPLSFSDET